MTDTPSTLSVAQSRIPEAGSDEDDSADRCPPQNTHKSQQQVSIIEGNSQSINTKRVKKMSVATAAVTVQRENGEWMCQAAADIEQLGKDTGEMDNMLKRQKSFSENSYFDLHNWSDDLHRAWTTDAEGNAHRSMILEQRAQREQERDERVERARSLVDVVMYSHPLIGRRLRRPPTATNPKVTRTLGEYRPGTYKNYLACNGLEPSNTPAALMKRPTSAPAAQCGRAAFPAPLLRVLASSRPVSAAAQRRALSPPRDPTAAGRPTSTETLRDISQSKVISALNQEPDSTLVPPMLTAGKVNYRQLFAEQKAQMDVVAAHRKDVYEPIIHSLEEHNRIVQRRFSSYLNTHKRTI